MEFGLPWPGAEVARVAEAEGVTAFCTGDFVDNDAYEVLAEMVEHTESARVGTSIAYAFARTPYAHASAIRTLHKKAPGRLFLGLGSGAYSINRDWFGVEADKPVARMSDLAGAVRAWLHAENGERVRYEGPFYRVDARVQAPVLGKLDVPVLFAGFNKRMVAAAATHADGVIGHGLFTARWWQDIVRPAAGDVGEGWLEHGWLITSVDDRDPERAVRDARRMVGFYLTVKTYDPYVEYHGWTDEVARVRAAFAQGDIDGMAAAVSDEMLDAIAVCGSTDRAREQLGKRRAEGSLARDLTYLSPPSFLTSARRRAEYARNSLALLQS
ncbi:LLM class flavin-dependent oxidoreductase [Nocardia higoensis]|uniref:LLM class flavin-dependent oxidoreductase n=1 Tax=Nocardia higoensis TaxID=228599 RepID=UPI0002F351A3|nr:LLM class flavin-dependent oxidoreductase [Nocardia higoensis]